MRNCNHPEDVHVSFGTESALKVVLSCLLLCSINQLFFIHQFLSQVLHLGSPCLIITSVSFKFWSGCIKWIYYLLCRSFSLSPPGTSKTENERTHTCGVSEGLHQGDVSSPSESVWRESLEIGGRWPVWTLERFSLIQTCATVRWAISSEMRRCQEESLLAWANRAISANCVCFWFVFFSPTFIAMCLWM